MTLIIGDAALNGSRNFLNLLAESLYLFTFFFAHNWIFLGGRKILFAANTLQKRGELLLFADYFPLFSSL